MAVKKVSISLDMVIVIAVVFIISFGYNLYQKYQYQDLLQEHVDVMWHDQNMEINWKYVKGLLEKCEGKNKEDIKDKS